MAKFRTDAQREADRNRRIMLVIFFVLAIVLLTVFSISTNPDYQYH